MKHTHPLAEPSTCANGAGWGRVIASARENRLAIGAVFRRRGQLYEVVAAFNTPTRGRHGAKGRLRSMCFSCGGWFTFFASTKDARRGALHRQCEHHRPQGRRVFS